MRCAIARAASRRGSSTRSRLPRAQGCAASASGTTVLLPAPGGASSTAPVWAASAALSGVSASSIGSPDFTSPDTDTLVRRQEELVARLHVEGRIPGVHVAYHAVDAESRRTVRIAGHLCAQVLLALLLAPYLRPAEEKALIAAEAVQHRRRGPVQRAVIRRVGYRQAAQVTDVLAERQAAVEPQAGQ